MVQTRKAAAMRVNVMSSSHFLHHTCTRSTIYYAAHVLMLKPPEAATQLPVRGFYRLFQDYVWEMHRRVEEGMFALIDGEGDGGFVLYNDELLLCRRELCGTALMMFLKLVEYGISVQEMRRGCSR